MKSVAVITNASHAVVYTRIPYLTMSSSLLTLRSAENPSSSSLTFSFFFFFQKNIGSRSGRVGSGQVGGDGGRPVCHTGPYYNLQIPNTPSMVLFLELGLQVIILPTLDFIQGAPGCEEEK